MNMVFEETATGFIYYDADLPCNKEKVVPDCIDGEHEWKKKSNKRHDISTLLGKSVTGQVVYEQCVKCKETKNAEVVIGLTCPELRQLV